MDGVTYGNRCLAKAACKLDGSTSGACTCTPNPGGACTADYAPVCGKDGVTYSNWCEAHRACQHDGSTRGACTPCATPVDFILVLDESGSMKKPSPDGSMEGPNGMKAFAKQLVSQYSLGEDAVRFSVVSFASDATTRVPWSYDAAQISAGIDEMSADGRTSISDAFEAARQLFADGGRAAATKFVLFVSDGEQTVDAAPGKTLLQTAIDAAALVKGDGATVFAWGFGSKLQSSTLEQIATDPSMAILAEEIGELRNYRFQLKAAVCNVSTW